MRYIIAALLLVSHFANANPAEVRVITRGIDGTPFRAYILPLGSEDRLVVRLYDPRRIAEFSLFSADGQQGGHIENIEWSKDAMFLVFSTSSSGGHSPWNFRTYVFSTERCSFLSLDDAIAPVTSPTFTFIDSSHLEVEALKSASASIDDPEKRVIDLEALPWKTLKTEQGAAANP